MYLHALQGLNCALTYLLHGVVPFVSKLEMTVAFLFAGFDLKSLTRREAIRILASFFDGDQRLPVFRPL